MDMFQFTVAMLAAGRASSASHNAQFIAQRIVEEHLLAGFEITPGVKHFAVDQTPVDISQ